MRPGRHCPTCEKLMNIMSATWSPSWRVGKKQYKQPRLTWRPPTQPCSSRKVTKEYMAEVIKAHEGHDVAHAQEQEAQKQAINTNNTKDPVVCLLNITCQVACEQANWTVDVFLDKIKETLKKHIPVNAQGPLMVNALSTTMQFQMSIWHMIGDECIRPMCAKHSKWC